VRDEVVALIETAMLFGRIGRPKYSAPQMGYGFGGCTQTEPRP
jgi:hypothetical protein